MRDPHIRALGQVQDFEEQDLIVGVEYDLVVLREPGQMGKQWRLDSKAVEELAQLIVAATWEASRNG